MSRLKALQDRHAATINAMEAILDEVDGDLLTEEQTSTYDALNKELTEEIIPDLEREQKLQDHIRSLSNHPNTRLPEDGFNPGPSGSLRDTSAGTPTRGAKTYAALHGLSRLSNDGWSSFDSYLDVIHAGVSHPQIRAAASEGVGSTGGFLVPEQFAARLLDSALENEIVRPRADVWPMQNETLKVAGVDASDSSSDLFGGISGEWIGEGGTLTLEDISFRKVKLHARKLAVLSKASNEVREDGVSFEDQLEDALRKAISWHLDYAFLRGTGAGQPLGVLNDPALVAVPREAEQAADTILYENLIKMLARLHTSCFSRSVWVANPTCIPQLLQLTIPIGTSGAHIPVMKETDGAFSILTRPVLFTEKLPTVGDAGDILLAEFSQYVVGMRREMTLDKSMHIYFASDETGYRGILRVDGQGKWSKAYTPKHGDSQSWCVVLEAR